MHEQPQENCTTWNENTACTTVTSQYANVNVAVKLKPCAKVGNLVTECCGEPVLAFHPYQGASGSCGCELTITQTICIKIPIAYSAQADVEDTTAVCMRTNDPCTGYR